jgi:hypothetical protein
MAGLGWIHNRVREIRDFFSFFTFFFPLFLQKYMVRKKFCKTIHLAPWVTAAGTYRRAPRR